MEKWLSIEEAASFLGVTDKTIYRRVEKGKIKNRELNGERQVCVMTEDIPSDVLSSNDNGFVEQLRSEIEFLRQQNQNLCQKESEIVTQLRSEIESLKPQNDSIRQEESEIVGNLKTEIDHLRQQNDHLTQLMALSQKNLGALTEQVSEKDKLIEDLRHPPQDWWQRFWATFGVPKKIASKSRS